jgi:hypothetical protein
MLAATSGTLRVLCESFALLAVKSFWFVIPRSEATRDLQLDSAHGTASLRQRNLTFRLTFS